MDVQVQLPEKFSHTFDLNVILGKSSGERHRRSGQTEEKRLKLRIVFQKVCAVSCKKQSMFLSKLDVFFFILAKKRARNIRFPAPAYQFMKMLYIYSITFTKNISFP